MPARFPWLALVFALSFLSMAQSPVLAASRQASPPSTTISGGDLPYPVHLSAADEDAFFRRLDPPPEPEVAPPATGPTYRVTSAYWDYALHLRDDSRPRAGGDASYYPSTGHARARLDGEDVWLLLDQRQRALLDRYIRLAQAGSIGAEPGVFEVIRAAAETEPVGVMVGPLHLNPDETQRFWQVAAPLIPRRDLIQGAPASAAWPPQGRSVTWVVLTLTEGRSVELVYDVARGLVVDRFATEAYPVPEDWLVPVLGSIADLGAPEFGLAPVEIQHDEGRGMHVWWALMAVLGAFAIAAAVMLRRRNAIRT